MFNQNYLRFSLLHIAAVCDNVDAAILLTKYGANPLQRDILGRTSLHLAKSSEMLKVLLSEKGSLEVSSGVFRMVDVVYFCLSFKFIPALLKSCACSVIDSKVNIVDNKGNTPLHSMVIRISDIDKCLDAIETLVNKGAATDVRCEKGCLPIDNFRAISLKFNERVEERGERLLGGNATNRYTKIEKQFYTILSCAFILFYLLVYISNAKNMCIKTETNKDSDNFPRVIIKWYVSCTQIVVILAMNYLFGVLNTRLHAFTVRKFEVKPTWHMLYSEQLLVAFLGKISIAFIIVRVVCFFFDQSIFTDIFFNVYCTFLCYFLFMIYFKTPCRNIFRKYYSFCISAIKICTVFYLIFWIQFVMLFYGQHMTDSSKLYDDGGWVDLIFTIASKFVLFFLYVVLLWFRLLRPLFFVSYKPVFWHSVKYVQFFPAYLLWFFLVDILSVPLTLVWCRFQK